MAIEWIFQILERLGKDGGVPSLKVGRGSSTLGGQMQLDQTPVCTGLLLTKGKKGSMTGQRTIVVNNNEEDVSVCMNGNKARSGLECRRRRIGQLSQVRSEGEGHG
jgi:hypothetical protein